MPTLTNIAVLPTVSILVWLSLFGQDSLPIEINDTNRAFGRECSIDAPKHLSTQATQFPQAIERKPVGEWWILTCIASAVIETVVGLTLFCYFRRRPFTNISGHGPRMTGYPCKREVTCSCDDELEYQTQTAINETKPHCYHETLRLQDMQMCSLRDELAAARAENVRLLLRRASLQSMCSDGYSSSDGYSDAGGSGITSTDTSTHPSESDVGGGRDGSSWEWPLSKDEAQLRVRIIDDRIHALDKSELVEEVFKMEQLFETAMNELAKISSDSAWAEVARKHARKCF